MNISSLGSNVTLPRVYPFPETCFAPTFRRPAGFVVLSDQLDFAYVLIAAFILAAFGLRLSLKIWNDDAGHFRAFVRATPLLCLAATYMFARAVPELCLSPLAYGHWFVSGFAFLLVERALAMSAGLEPRRAGLIIFLDMLSFGGYALGCRDPDTTKGVFSAVFGLNLVSLYLVSLLLIESARGYSEDGGAHDRLAGMALLKILLTIVLSIGPVAARWVPDVIVVYIVGSIEILAVLHGVKEFDVHGFLFGN